MNPQSLEKFREAYARLLVHEVQLRLGLAAADTAVGDEEARFLVQMASCLAFGDPSGDDATNALWKNWAYDVVTRIAVGRANSDPRYVRAAETILARIGNFPGRDFLRIRHSDPTSANPRISPTLILEELTHESDNTLTFNGLGERTLTDFQVRLIEQLRSRSSVSVSAPTSAGKSFALTLDIVDVIASGTASVVVYVVPTRALIRQVMNDLLARLREAALHQVAVSSTPIALDDKQMADGVVYVLTQERLNSLLYSPDAKIKVDRVYVDEAQELGDLERGMILHSAVQGILKDFPKISVCFASPLTANPDFLFEEFSVDEARPPFVERHTPVAQLIVVLDEVRDDTKVVDVSVQTPAGSRDLGRIEVPFKFRGVSRRLANTACFVTAIEESTIVYANGPAEAMEVAMFIAEQLEPRKLHPDVISLRNFVRSHIHRRYALADTLSKGVAFHYGKMPHILRGHVEDLLKQRKLQYVVCTSTLLQGINLPANNIVIMAPRKGPGRPMTSPDFWNLAGRVGRLRESFNGTVWCINPSKWVENPLAGASLSEITSAFRESLKDENVSAGVLAVINDPNILGQVAKREQVEQVFGKVFAEFTCEQQQIARSKFAASADPQQMAAIDLGCQRILGQMRVPLDVCKRNATISPLSLDDLWGRFARSRDIERLMPIDPNARGALDRMREIFRLIDEVFSGQTGDSYIYFATMAYWWISGQSIGDMIYNHIGYYKVPDEVGSINASIRQLLENLESVVRFRYVKYLKAYNDVLGTFLEAIQRQNLRRSLVPLHLYIEFGARDRVLVMLMSMGLSRTTAIFIRPSVTREADITRRDCWQRLLDLPVQVLDIPDICKEEIRHLRGRR